MADTVELFIAGASLDEIRYRIEQCSGTTSESDEYGDPSFEQPDFIASLGVHSYEDDGDLDFSSYPYELTAKNYRDPDLVDPLDSATVQWFRQLFACLRSQGGLGLLLTYNLQSALGRFDSRS